jgi:ABC-type multidrug transport system fused ATPase/permease subunit
VTLSGAQALANVASPFLLREIIDRALPERSAVLVSWFAALAVGVAALVMDWTLALMCLVAIPLFLLFSLRLGRRRRGLAKRRQQRMVGLTGLIEESLSVGGVHQHAAPAGRADDGAAEHRRAGVAVDGHARGIATLSRRFRGATRCGARRSADDGRVVPVRR